jgi:hypothetical protein
MARPLAFLSPTTVARHLRFIALPLILSAGVAGSVRAQGSGTAAEPHPDTGGSAHQYGPPRRGMRLDAVQGPVSPAVLRDSIHVSGDKLQQYTKRYDAYMASTKATRDSLRTNVQAIRSAFQSGDRSAVRGQRDVVRQQSDDLAKRDQEFEKKLQDVLTKDQETQYNEWKQRRAESNRSRWRAHRQHRSGDSTTEQHSR